ncbi:hypothetical protein AAG747_28850 [Rapidithrix thailandica]|uniref:DUF4259 domain-containing protein n=1 Tax=Rapidithrix thailandica TaxID=413964 RepID=A0AAW9SLD1_9BACT
MWGNQPWDNDCAADWFAKTIGDSGLATRVRNTLQELLAQEYWDDEALLVRAASYCLLQFGHVYVWPIDELEKDLDLAIQGLKRVLEEGEYFDPEILQVEIAELENRLSVLQSR